ncbi:MAG: MBL fold metallo-hydrolase [Deltaproteobacteria bacterium]
MKIQFCGAARTVTGSCHLVTLDDGYKILLDCGLYQGRDEEFADFNGKWIFNPADIDCVILSHAHIDHCGRIPKLTKDGYSGEIICTSATRDLSAVMLIDSAKLQERDAWYINKKRKRSGKFRKAEPLYTVQDVYKALESFVGISYNVWHELGKGVAVQLRDSGHIFGSASVTLKISRNGQPPVFLGFSGDIGRPARPILKDPVPMENLDYLICESTYGGERHKQLPEDEEDLLRIIYETCIKNKGKLLIPAFSLGRTQEIVYILDKLEHDGRLPEIPVFVDSPMAVNATEVFRMHPECFDSEIIEYMIDDPNPFGFNNLKYIRRTEDSKRLNYLEGPAVIISASGMMTGGRILHHLNNNIEDGRNTVLIVGFCAPHTLGARIREGQKRIKIFGVEKDVNAKVVVMDSFSAHGDQPEMLSYLSGLDRKKLKNVSLVHGEYGRQQFFRSALEEQGFGNIDIPELGQVFEFNPAE